MTVPPISVIHVGLGEADVAFERLDRAARGRDGPLIYILAPEYHDLTPDPRYAALLRKMGLGYLAAKAAATGVP